jgi:hypothetical protein
VILYLAIAGVVVAGLGLFTRSPVLLALAVAMVVPFALYLSGAPRFRGFAWLLPLPLVAAAWLVRPRQAAAAWLVGLFSVGFLAVEVMLFGAFR